MSDNQSQVEKQNNDARSIYKVLTTNSRLKAWGNRADYKVNHSLMARRIAIETAVSHSDACCNNQRNTEYLMRNKLVRIAAGKPVTACLSHIYMAKTRSVERGPNERKILLKNYVSAMLQGEPRQEGQQVDTGMGNLLESGKKRHLEKQCAQVSF